VITDVVAGTRLAQKLVAINEVFEDMLVVLPNFTGHCLLETTCCCCSVDANSICFQLDVMLDGGDNMIASSLCFTVCELVGGQLNQKISSLAAIFRPFSAHF